MRPIKARGRVGRLDGLEGGEGEAFQTFLWLTNVAMGFLDIGQKLRLVLKFSLEYGAPRSTFLFQYRGEMA